MSLKSAYHAQHSLPNRSPTTRPRSLSLTDYQPLAFDREATQAAYQASLDFPASSVSSLSNHSTNSFSGHGSAETAATSAGLGTGTGTAMSSTSLSHYLKPGDNPHFPTRPASAGGLPPPPSNFAGIGAGHTLTPPQSPIHSAVSQVNLNRSSLLSPVPQSPLTPGMNAEPSPNFLSSEESMQATGRIPPTPESPFFPNMRMTRRASAMDVDGGEEYMGGPAGAQGSQGGGGKRRALPVVPTNVPTPVSIIVCQDAGSSLTLLGTASVGVSIRFSSTIITDTADIRPDYKPQIPPELVAASAQNAYASLSAPPPNLPPRRNPQRRASRGRTQSTSRMGNAQAGPSGRSYGDSSVAGGSGSSSQRTNPSRLVPPPLPSRMQSSTSNANGGSGMVVDPQPPQGNGGSLAQPPPGAPSFPPVNGIMPTQTRPKRTAPIEQGIILTAHDDKGIWSTHFVDPSLRKPIANMPPQLTNMTNTVLSGLASGPKTRFNTTTGAPIDGMAQLAKDWFVAPDAKFSSEQGGIELSLAIVDGSSEEEWGSDKGRKKARIDIGSKLGGIKVDLVGLAMPMPDTSSEKVLLIADGNRGKSSSRHKDRDQIWRRPCPSSRQLPRAHSHHLNDQTARVSTHPVGADQTGRSAIRKLLHDLRTSPCTITSSCTTI